MYARVMQNAEGRWTWKRYDDEDNLVFEFDKSATQKRAVAWAQADNPGVEIRVDEELA